MDVDNPGLLEVGGLEMSPMLESTDQLIRSVIDSARESDVNPWQHELRVKSYYANASVETWELTVSITPFTTGEVTIEVAKLMAGALPGAILQNILPVPHWLKKEQRGVSKR